MASNSEVVKPQNLFGRGRIINVAEKFAFVQDSHERNVFVPLQAVLTERCNDLRKKFGINDEVIFMAKKQFRSKGTTDYQATSIVKRADLEIEEGRIVDVSSGCAFGETSRGAKVFIPFTAKNGADHEWRMKGASEGANCVFGLMPQVEKSDCRLLAATIVLTGGKNSKAQLSTSCLNLSQPQPAAHHLGIVLPFKDSKCIYSAETGYTALSSHLNNALKLGSWVKYAVSETADNNFNWMAINVNTWQQPDKVSVMVDKAGGIRVDANALVCRVDATRMWFWNDFLGRMFKKDYTITFPSKTVVHVLARYAPGGALNDTNWEVESVVMTSQDERRTCAQKLETDGIWKVNAVTQISDEKFTATLESKIHGLASMLWMDVVGGCAPRRGDICHAAVVRQYLPHLGALPYRAVLVFPVQNHRPLSPARRAPTPPPKKPVKQEPKIAAPKKVMKPVPTQTQKAPKSEELECPKKIGWEQELKNAYFVSIFKEVLSDDELFKQIFMRFPQHAEKFNEVLKTT